MWPLQCQKGCTLGCQSPLLALPECAWVNARLALTLTKDWAGGAGCWPKLTFAPSLCLGVLGSHPGLAPCLALQEPVSFLSCQPHWGLSVNWSSRLLLTPVALNQASWFQTLRSRKLPGKTPSHHT